MKYSVNEQRSLKLYPLDYGQQDNRQSKGVKQWEDRRPMGIQLEAPRSIITTSVNKT
jgi:hypothetical protein